jgi:hypothetical protein
MKKLYVWILVFIFSFGDLISQNANEVQGNVNSYSGKYVFWNHEPTNEYEIVFLFSFVNDLITQHNQPLQSEEAVKSAYMSSLGKDFDAVIVGKTKMDMAIKFKSPSANKSLCKAIQINNTSVFIDAKPSFNYTVKEVVEYKRRKDGMSKIKLFSSAQIAENLIIYNNPVSPILLIGNGNTHEWIEKK